MVCGSVIHKYVALVVRLGPEAGSPGRTTRDQPPFQSPMALSGAPGAAPSTGWPAGPSAEHLERLQVLIEPSLTVSAKPHFLDCTGPILEPLANYTQSLFGIFGFIAQSTLEGPSMFRSRQDPCTSLLRAAAHSQARRQPPHFQIRLFHSSTLHTIHSGLQLLARHQCHHEALVGSRGG